jgi:Domain of unknown function (DUF5655)
MTQVSKFGEVTVDPVKNCILLRSVSTFLALNPRADCMDVEFLLDEEVDVFPIHKAIRVSKNRVAHFIRLEHAKDVNKQLIAWLRRAYELASK